MSEQFIQYIFPCHECIVQAACRDKDRLRIIEENDKTKPQHLRSGKPSLAVPIFDPNNKSYHKGLMECCVNISRDVMEKVSKTEYPIGHQKKDNLPMAYVNVLWAITQIMCHMVNSISWEEGNLHDFDRIEIKKRLTKLKGWI